MFCFLKIVERFQISILKYYDTENLSYFQEEEGLFRQRLKHGQSTIKLLFTF